jgi:HK97 family phage major capsid protein
MKDIKDVLFERGKVVEEMKSILAKADQEKRDMSADELEQFDKLDAKQTELKNQADRLHKLQTLESEGSQYLNTPALPAVGGTDKKSVLASAEYTSGFDRFARVGKNGLDINVLNALQVGTASEGGYIVPTEFETMLVEALQDINEFRQWCNVISTGSDRDIPVESTLGSATWTAEEAAYTESDAAFGQVVLSSYKLGRIIKVSEELLEDAFFDVPGYLARNFGKSFGIAEEAAIVNGDGSGKPTGLVQGASAGVTAASNAAITADELIDLFHALGRPYRNQARWVLNDDTAKLVRELKDGNGQYLWQPGLQAGQPDMILGRPAVSSSAMPTVASTATSVLFGDLSYYTIADRTGRVMQRLNELYAANGQVGFRMYERLDGKVVLSDAIKKLDHPV